MSLQIFCPPKHPIFQMRNQLIWTTHGLFAMIRRVFAMISRVFVMISVLWEKCDIPPYGSYLMYITIYGNPNNNNKVKWRDAQTLGESQKWCWVKWSYSWWEGLTAAINFHLTSLSRMIIDGAHQRLMCVGNQISLDLTLGNQLSSHFIPIHQVRVSWPCFHSPLITQLHSPSLHFIDIHPVSSYFIPVFK